MTSKQIIASRNKLWIILAIVIGVLVTIRILLPTVLLHFANKNLAAMKGYYGHIYDIDLSILQGAYRVDSIYLNKVDSVTKKQTPFFSAAHVDLSIEWRALLHGSLVGEVTVESPVIRFTKNKVEPAELIKDSTYFKKLLNRSMPLKVNFLEVKNGTLRYKDESTNPSVDIALTNGHVVAQNLRNSYDSTSFLPAKIKINAMFYEGTLDFTMKLNFLAAHPTFDLNTELRNTNLVKLNDFLQAYAKIDVNKGTFGAYAEVAAKEGRFIGYIKPLIRDLDIVGKEDRDDNVLRKLWEGMAGATSQVFRNQEKDQLATKIEFSGTVENPHTSVWYTIVDILRNAFIHALQPAIDNQISIASMKKEKRTFLQKVFGKKV